MEISRRNLIKGGLGLVAFTTGNFLAGCTRGLPETERNAGLPKQIVWATFPAGTGTYNDVAAVAGMLTKSTGTQVRLMTGDTGISRVAPLISGTADYARVGDEFYYAFEGDEEYASETWGPQPIRQIWTPPGNYGVLVRKDSGIERVEDLRGKRYPKLIASTSMNRKLEAILNFGGLSLDDVELVDIAYSEQAEAMKTGHVQAIYHNVVGASVEELASQYPIRWLDLSSTDKSRYKTWKDLSPMVKAGEFSNGAGMEKNETCVNMQYSLPLITCAEKSAEEVYKLVGLIDSHLEDYVRATPDAKKFSISEILTTPLVVPFHLGAINYLKTKNKWSEKLEKRQQALLHREDEMKEAWPGFLERHGSSSNLRGEWKQWKKENLAPLPSTD